MITEDDEWSRIEREIKRREEDDDTQEYVAQREWVGLTKEDIFEIAERLGLADIAWKDVMLAVEAALKKRNK